MKSKIICSFAIAATTIFFNACNKDEEIIIDSPDVPTSGVFTVMEYTPAPGQFINESASGFNNITTPEEACAYAEERLAHTNYVSLGGWGGYIVVKCPKVIENTGQYEFSIAGNSFGTSNEPGIVWVMKDSNGNGLADDDWFQLRGSEYDAPGFVKDYWVTYYKGDKKSAIKWVDSLGNTGIIDWLGEFHQQESYFPKWVATDSYTLYGSRLSDNAVLNTETGDWSTLPFSWGYVDNKGEDSAIEEINGKRVIKNYFRISDAVKADGTAADLNSIDFIKVQTGVNGNCGRLGEISTEVCGFFIENQ